MNTITINTITQAPSLRQAFSRLQENKERFVKSKPANIESIGLRTRGGMRGILRQVRNERSEVDCYATLCPFYDGSGIRGDYTSIKDAPLRFQKKFEATVAGIKFFQSQIPLRVSFLLADQGILAKPEYDRGRLDTDIAGIKSIYQEAIDRALWADQSIPIVTFSDIGLDMPRVNPTEESYTARDAEWILESYEIDPKRFRYQLAIISAAFGPTNAYFLLRDYLAESAFLSQRFRNTLFINTEACTPLNSLYTLGSQRVVDTNCVAAVNINI